MHYTCGLMQPGPTLLASFDLYSGFPEIDNNDSFIHLLLGILTSLDVYIQVRLKKFEYRRKHFFIHKMKRSYILD